VDKAPLLALQAAPMAKKALSPALKAATLTKKAPRLHQKEALSRV
jgi:hypothetical protein